MSAAPEKKYNRRSCTCPMLAVVFCQTLTVCTIILAIPIGILFKLMYDSNNLSSQVGYTTASFMAEEVQANEGTVAIADLALLISNVERIVVDAGLSMSHYVDLSKPDSILNSLALVQTTNNYEQSLYYSSIDNDFVGIIASNAGDARVYVNLPLHVNRSDCSICGFWESLSPQELTIADKAGDFSWASWNMFAQAIDGNFHLVNKKFEARSEQWYQAALLAENGESGWTLPFRSSTSNQAVISVARRVYDANKTLQGVVATEIPLTYLTSALQEHLQSQHAYMYLATANGSLVGSSANETLFDSEGNVKDVAQMLRPQMQWSAAYLQNLLLPGENWTSLAGAYTWNGTYFGVSVMQEGPRFVVVTGAPVADYTGPIDRMFHSLAGTLQNCFQAISGFAVTVFAITVVLSCILCHYFVDRPLRKVTDMMAKAREFDFSDFETDEQAHGNIITELNVMESAFLKMIHKFASAIRSNREMNSKKSNLKSGASNQEAASYQPPNLVESKVEYDLPFSESKHTTMARKKRDGQQDEI